MGNIDRLKALYQLDISVQLDKNTVGSANFIFEIRTLTSIRSVNLETLLGSITFHIVLVNTLFLQCLADMNKLGAFFNNIAHEMIQI